MRFYKLLNRMSFDTEVRRDERRDTGWPIEPSIALLAREAEDHCVSASAIDQLSFHALQAEPSEMSFRYLVRGTCLHERDIRASREALLLECLAD